MDTVKNNASSTASNVPGGIPGLVAVAGATIIAGFETASYAWKAHKKKSRRKAMEEINQLHDQYLKNISYRRTDDGDPTPLPIIFQQNPQDPSLFQSVNVSQAIMSSIITKVTEFRNNTIGEYKQHVTNAMKTIKDYYDWRLQTANAIEKLWGNKTEDDVTSNVLCYTLLMLSEHCLNFEGYKQDIAYVRQLGKFLQAFMCQHNQKHSARKVHLKPAYVSLGKAQRVLELHVKKRTPDELIQEIATHVESSAQILFKNYLKLLVPASQWRYAETAQHERIKNGLIKEAQKYKVLWNLLNKEDPAIPLPDIIFSTFIKQYAANYTHATASESSTNNLVDLTSTKFRAPDYYINLEDELKKIDAKLKHASKSKRSEARNNFIKRHKRNLIEREKIELFVDQSPVFSILKPNKDENLKDAERENANRAAYETSIHIFSYYATALDKLIALHYYCNELLKFIQHNGLENFLHRVQTKLVILNVLQGLDEQLMEISAYLTRNFKKIKDDALNKEGMFTAEQSTSLEDISYTLENIEITLHKAITEFIGQQNIDSKINYNETIDCQTDEYKGLEPFCKIALGHDIKTGISCIKHIHESNEDTICNKHTKENALHGTAKTSSNSNKFIKEITINKSQEGKSPDRNLALPHPSERLEGEPEAKTHERTAVKLPKKLAVRLPAKFTTEEILYKISERIEALTKKNPSSTNDAYEEAYDALTNLHDHATSLKKESSSKRKNKGINMDKLVWKLANETLEFLMQKKNELRKSNFSAFTTRIDDILENSEFLDEHKSFFHEFGNSVKGGAKYLFSTGDEYRHNKNVLFKTKSRIAANTFKECLEKVDTSMRVEA